MCCAVDNVQDTILNMLIYKIQMGASLKQSYVFLNWSVASGTNVQLCSYDQENEGKTGLGDNICL